MTYPDSSEAPNTTPQPPQQQPPSRNWWGFVLAMIILALVALGIFYALMQMFRQTAEGITAPLSDANQRVSTQMAQLLQPTPTILPDPVTIVHDVRSLARLETIQYTLEKVVTAETNQGQLGFLFGDKLIFVAHGTVIAGIDMAKLRPEDVKVTGSILYVTLPPPEIFVATLDNQKSYVYNRDTGLLTKPQTDLETQARAVAEKEIYKAAIDDGILTQAQQNAESYLSRLFESMGYKEVIFTESTPQPYAPPALEPTEVSPTVTPTPGK